MRDRALVAQGTEHAPPKRWVDGSNPSERVEVWYQFVDGDGTWYSEAAAQGWQNFYHEHEVEICEITRDQKRMTAFTLRGY